MEIVTRDREGRAGVAARNLEFGELFLTEKAALFWSLGEDELVGIIQAYQNATDDDKARVDGCTSEIRTRSNELDALIQSWGSTLDRAKVVGNHGPLFQRYRPLLMRAHFNAHAVQSPAGACLFPRGAMLNHSCSPNTVYKCEAHTISFRAKNGIQEGSELTACYLDALAMLKPTVHRQKVLLLSKGFICRCTRCSSIDLDVTRAVWCPAENCTGTVLPGNDTMASSEDMSASPWKCPTCDLVLPESDAQRIRQTEDELYKQWQDNDARLSNGISLSAKQINEAIRLACKLLHPSHFITQLQRVLAIEIGASSKLEEYQLLHHAFTFANWLYTTFRDTVPLNLLGTMTGALAELFDRKTHVIKAGLNVDRVLLMMKAVLPLATIRHGESGLYPQALRAVLERYSVCSALTCTQKGKLSRCGRCESAFYCSRSCQIFHFKSQGHKAVCQAVVEARKQIQAAMEA